MLPTPPTASTAALYNYAEAELGIYLNAAGNAWPELRERLFALLSDRVAALPFVPSDWFADVKTACGTMYAPQLITPYNARGELKATAPSWLAKDKTYADAWAAIAAQTRGVVMAYAQGKLDEGRAEMARLNAIADFWDGLYRTTKAIADAPSNAVGAVAGGVQYVAGGVFGALAKSWIVWLVVLAAAGFGAWRFGLLATLAKKARAKAGK